MRLGYRNSAITVAVLLGCASICIAEPGPTAPDEIVDWCKIVPGDARFYVELRDLAGIRRLFQSLGIWETVRELTEQNTPGATTRPWQRTTEENLQLGAETAIQVFLGRRTALIATESGHWQNGVMLAELERAADLRVWLRRWRAKTLADEGPVHRYELPGGILLAAADRTLVFGPAGDPDSLWSRTVLLLAGRRGPTLAGRSEFAALRSRMSVNYPALLYVVWAEGDPTALEGCSRLLVGASVTESGIACELRGQRATGQEATEPPLDISVLQSLPASTLAVRAGSFDFDRLTGRVKKGKTSQDDALFMLFLRGLIEGGRGADEPDADLGPGYLVVLGRDKTAESRGFDMPAVTAICQAEGGESYVERLDRTIRFLAMLLGRVAAPTGKTPDPINVEITDCEGVPLHHVAVGPVLAARTGLRFLDGVDVCWALLDGRLIISSSSAHVQEIVRAARGKAPTLKDGADLKDSLPAANEATPTIEWWFARGSRVADMVATWLDYLQREQPEALRQDWWQQWASERIARRAQLGIGLAADPNDPRRAVIKEISAKSPAIRFLRTGDVIVGAAGSLLATSQPAHEVADRYTSRPNEQSFTLQILRNGKTLNVTIPIPQLPTVDLQDFDPVRSLRQLTTLSSHARTATVWKYASNPERFDARIQIHWEPAKKPTSRPTTMPTQRP